MHRADVPDIRAKELLTVVTLAEYGSFVAAAAHLKTSQPALTRTVKRVERVLGVTLFARNTRRVEITPAGREFVAVAERMLDDLQLTVRNLDEVTREQRGRVTVSTYSAFAVNPMPFFVRDYRDTRPLVEVRIREGRQFDILEDVRSGVADFGIGYVDELPEFVVGTALGRETFCVVMPVRHRLASRRSVSLADLRDEPVIGLPTESRTRRTLDVAAATAGVVLRQRVMVGQFATLMALVGAGVGIGIVPRGATRGPMARGLRSVPLGEPRITRRLGLMALREREPTPAAAGFIVLLRREWPRGD